MPVQNLLLYTTLGCHLCETAESLVLPLIDPNAYQLIKVEIAESDELVERYGIRIPIIAFEGERGEIGWPFDALQFEKFLKQDFAK